MLEFIQSHGKVSREDILTLFEGKSDAIAKIDKSLERLVKMGRLSLLDDQYQLLVHSDFDYTTGTFSCGATFEPLSLDSVQTSPDVSKITCDICLARIMGWAYQLIDRVQSRMAKNQGIDLDLVPEVQPELKDPCNVQQYLKFEETMTSYLKEKIYRFENRSFTHRIGFIEGLKFAVSAIESGEYKEESS